MIQISGSHADVGSSLKDTQVELEKDHGNSMFAF